MSLLALQRDFRAWLIGADENAAAKFGAAAHAGLGVYQNNYRAQLVACLEETYARVKAWLGDDAFLAAAIDHIDRTPPSDWTLDRYGHDFPETLRTCYPNDAEVAELAWLDRSLADAFVGPNVETLEAMPLQGADWDHAVLRLTPTLHLGHMTTNAAAIWSALSAGSTPPSVALPRSTLLVWRREFTSCFRTLDDQETRAIELCRNGRTFGELCAMLVDGNGEAEGVKIAGTWLAQWLRERLVVAVCMK
jgi:hypothetical protein